MNKFMTLVLAVLVSIITSCSNSNDQGKDNLNSNQKGDVVKCPPNVPHWHGASPDQEFIQIAITGRQKGSTEWLQAVIEEEYLK